LNEVASVKHGNRLSGFEIVGWAGLGVCAGLVAGFALSEWVGGVSRPRVAWLVKRRAGLPRPALTAAACARAAAAALAADPALRDLGLEATAVSMGAVELHGWVATRGLRARAGSAARAVAGIERVVNSILVRGEDDLDPRNLADQSA
jgi:hypothetical protein